ncbi:unnamed protein product, partial [Coregonus sp. 'balchen']
VKRIMWSKCVKPELPWHGKAASTMRRYFRKTSPVKTAVHTEEEPHIRATQADWNEGKPSQSQAKHHEAPVWAQRAKEQMKSEIYYDKTGTQPDTPIPGLSETALDLIDNVVDELKNTPSDLFGLHTDEPLVLPSSYKRQVAKSVHKELLSCTGSQESLWKAVSSGHMVKEIASSISLEVSKVTSKIGAIYHTNSVNHTDSPISPGPRTDTNVSWVSCAASDISEDLVLRILDFISYCRSPDSTWNGPQSRCSTDMTGDLMDAVMVELFTNTAMLTTPEDDHQQQWCKPSLTDLEKAARLVYEKMVRETGSAEALQDALKLRRKLAVTALADVVAKQVYKLFPEQESDSTYLPAQTSHKDDCPVTSHSNRQLTPELAAVQSASECIVNCKAVWEIISRLLQEISPNVPMEEKRHLYAQDLFHCAINQLSESPGMNLMGYNLSSALDAQDEALSYFIVAHLVQETLLLISSQTNGSSPEVDSASDISEDLVLRILDFISYCRSPDSTWNGPQSRCSTDMTGDLMDAVMVELFTNTAMLATPEDDHQQQWCKPSLTDLEKAARLVYEKMVRETGSAEALQDALKLRRKLAVTALADVVAKQVYKLFPEQESDSTYLPAQTSHKDDCPVTSHSNRQLTPELAAVQSASECIVNCKAVWEIISRLLQEISPNVPMEEKRHLYAQDLFHCAINQLSESPGMNLMGYNLSSALDAQDEALSYFIVAHLVQETLLLISSQTNGSSPEVDSASDISEDLVLRILDFISYCRSPDSTWNGPQSRCSTDMTGDLMDAVMVELFTNTAMLATPEDDHQQQWCKPSLTDLEKAARLVYEKMVRETGSAEALQDALKLRRKLAVTALADVVAKQVYKLFPEQESDSTYLPAQTSHKDDCPVTSHSNRQLTPELAAVQSASECIVNCKAVWEIISRLLQEISPNVPMEEKRHLYAQDLFHCAINQLSESPGMNLMGYNLSSALDAQDEALSYFIVAHLVQETLLLISSQTNGSSPEVDSASDISEDLVLRILDFISYCRSPDSTWNGPQSRCSTDMTGDLMDAVMVELFTNTAMLATPEDDHQQQWCKPSLTDLEKAARLVYEKMVRETGSAEALQDALKLRRKLAVTALADVVAKQVYKLFPEQESDSTYLPAQTSHKDDCPVTSHSNRQLTPELAAVQSASECIVNCKAVWEIISRLLQEISPNVPMEEKRHLYAQDLFHCAINQLSESPGMNLMGYNLSSALDAQDEALSYFIVAHLVQETLLLISSQTNGSSPEVDSGSHHQPESQTPLYVLKDLTMHLYVNTALTQRNSYHTVRKDNSVEGNAEGVIF